MQSPTTVKEPENPQRPSTEWGQRSWRLFDLTRHLAYSRRKKKIQPKLKNIHKISRRNLLSAMAMIICSSGKDCIDMWEVLLN